MNTEDLAETTVQKKKKMDRNRKKAAGAANIEESIEMVEKENIHSDTEEPEVKRDSRLEQPIRATNIGNSTMERVVERVGRLKIKQRNSPLVKSGNQPASNQSNAPVAKSVSLGHSEVPMSSRKNRIANLPNDHVVHQDKTFSEMTEILETGEEEEEDVEDSIVSGFVGTGRSKTDVTRKPCLNTVGEDLESLASTPAKNSKVTRGISCDFCGTVYDDAKGLRRHMKAKHR